MAMYLTNGTLNYNLTKEYILTPEQIAERNNMIPDYPDPNDERFKETLPVFTLENNLLCRDGVSIGKVYNNKTGKVVEITETTETGFKYQDTNEDALINKDNSIVVVEKLTRLKGKEETRLIAKFNVTSSNLMPINGNQSIFTEIEVDGVVLPNVVEIYQFPTLGEHTVKYTLSDPTSIGNNAFQNCSTLTNITIPNSITSIGNNVFYNCSSLQSVTIPDSVTSIGSAAFYHCSGLTSITISSGVTSIENQTFENCSGLTSVTIPNSVTTIGQGAFTLCSGLTNVAFGNSVTSIGGGAFNACTSLISIIIPNNVTSIGAAAFQSCSGLQSVTIGNGVTSIGNNAFYQCSGLTSVIIGSGVTSVGSQAFYNCINLSTITSHIMNAPSVGGNTFGGVKNGGTLYVPIGSSGYETWMNNQGNLGSFGWTKVELS